MTDDGHDRWHVRHTAYVLLILSAAATMAGHVLSARGRDGHTPFFSANDRSRWLTISALVDHGTYVIDQVRQRPGWQSIDMVRHTGRDGELHYYSSKPPLLPTLLAGQYGLIRLITGASFEHYPFQVARSMLLMTNVLPMILLFVLLARWVEAFGETDFGRIFVVACACWGTLLTPFATTLNNHLPAAIGVLISALCVWRIASREDAPGGLFAIAGLASGFAAANDLPALSFTALTGLCLLWIAPRRTLIWFVPALAVVAVAFFGTNWIAHGSWRPPYAHRQPGDNWYDYPGSYWYGNRQGVDLGEPSRAVYLFHVLIGHHGFFSLTPIWLIALSAAVLGLRHEDGRFRVLSGVAILLFVVCVTYYVGFRPQRDRNYGGITSGFRWLFWQIPLWLMVMLPAADWLSETRWRRGAALILFTASAVSAAIPATNPWSHPWLYRLLVSG